MTARRASPHASPVLNGRAMVKKIKKKLNAEGGKTGWLVGFDGPPPGDPIWQSGRLIPSSTAGLWRLTLDSAEGIDRFLDEARGRGLLLRHLERERGTLEEIYLQLADAGGPSS